MQPYHFFTFYAFIVHILGLLFNFNTFNLALFVFFASSILNIYYLAIYNIYQNMIKLPFDIIFHILPLYFVNKYKSNYDNNLLVIGLIIIYLLIFPFSKIVQLYKDPYKIINQYITCNHLNKKK
jgi:hypothetical protein